MPESTVPEQPNEQEKVTASTAGSEKTETEGHMIPKARLDEVIADRKKLEERLAVLEKTSKDAEEQRLADQEKWRELAEKRLEELESVKPKAAVAEEQEASLQKYLQAQIDEIPEDMRSLIPEQLTTLQKLDWLSINKAKLLKPTAPNIGAGMRGAGSGNLASVELSPEEKEVAKKFGMSEKEYAEYKNKETLTDL